MATNLAGDFCIQQYGVCHLRVSRLGSNCAPLTGANNGAVSASILTLTASPEIEEGQAYEFKNGCGVLIANALDCDRIKRWNLTGELLTFDYELLEIMFGGELITGAVASSFAGEVIGWASPGSTADCSNGAALEVWTKISVGPGSCTPAANPPLFTRHIFPKVVFTPGDKTFENDIARVAFTGKAVENPAWGNGAFNDYPGVYPGPLESGYFQFVEAAMPSGVTTAGCGYVTVPADAS